MVIGFRRLVSQQVLSSLHTIHAIPFILLLP